MSTPRNVEARSTPDERAPLLASNPGRPDPDAPLNAEESFPISHKAGCSKWTYAWRGICIVVALLIIAVFVKGWIDSDNVDVSSCIL
jgi:hypothetical protein